MQYKKILSSSSMRGFVDNIMSSPVIGLNGEKMEGKKVSLHVLAGVLVGLKAEGLDPRVVHLKYGEVAEVATALWPQYSVWWSNIPALYNKLAEPLSAQFPSLAVERCDATDSDTYANWIARMESRYGKELSVKPDDAPPSTLF